MRKDLTLALACSEEVGATIELAKLSHDYYLALEKKGFG